jgi:mRNA interferase RelE/StbE
VAAPQKAPGAGIRRYALEFLEVALQEWKSLDGSVREVLKKILVKRLENPRVPGAELHGPLADCYKIKLRKIGYRLVYQVRDEALVVLVIAVDRRDKDKVYQAAAARVESLLEASSNPPRTRVKKRH